MGKEFDNTDRFTIPPGMCYKNPDSPNGCQQCKHQWNKAKEINPEFKDENLELFRRQFSWDQIDKTKTQCQKSQQNAETA